MAPPRKFHENPSYRQKDKRTNAGENTEGNNSSVSGGNPFSHKLSRQHVWGFGLVMPCPLLLCHGPSVKTLALELG